MAPDRGSPTLHPVRSPEYQNSDAKDHGNDRNVDDEPDDTAFTDQLSESSEDEDAAARQLSRQRSDAANFLAERADEGQNFTLRGVLVGLAIGVIICFSNMYFGLQTGWISGMAMPASLIGFAFFKTISRHIDYPFTPVENVLVQTVAGAVGTMPLGCGFVGVIPALDYMLTPEENGPLVLGTWKLMIWAVGICFFGVFFAVPLRREVIIREKLKFPSGTATALMIGVLHGEKDDTGLVRKDSGMETFRRRSRDVRRSSTLSGILPRCGLGPDGEETATQTSEANEDGAETEQGSDWKARIRLLVIAFAISAIYTLISYFIPQLRNIPIFGLPLATNWLWTLNPSPAYIGQGIIMGPTTTLHMLLGAIVGWGILSPLAKSKGWAPGPVEDWSTGSKGWIVWVSLSIMLADSIVSLGWLTLRLLLLYAAQYISEIRERAKRGRLWDIFHRGSSKKGNYTALDASDPSSTPTPQIFNSTQHHNARPISTPTAKPFSKSSLPEPDAPPEHLVSTRTVLIGLALSVLLCIASVHLVFGSLIPPYATLLAILFALLLSVMGVRALGETDLNPVSGISKLTQLAFAVLLPTASKNAIIINLLAGAISESGALQSGDMMQDLKTGHLLGAAPKAQFWGQLVGSFVGAVASAAVYRLYTSVYKVPGDMFQVPTGYVWIFTARLVTGRGLPEMAWQWAVGGGAVFVVLTAVRLAAVGTRWGAFVPGGIAVAVGMYNVPSFTLARTIGGLLNWYWRDYRRREETPVIVLASGLILGEGVISIVNLVLASLGVGHL